MEFCRLSSRTFYLVANLRIANKNKSDNQESGRSISRSVVHHMEGSESSLGLCKRDKVRYVIRCEERAIHRMQPVVSGLKTRHYRSLGSFTAAGKLQMNFPRSAFLHIPSGMRVESLLRRSIFFSRRRWLNSNFSSWLHTAAWLPIESQIGGLPETNPPVGGLIAPSIASDIPYVGWSVCRLKSHCFSRRRGRESTYVRFQLPHPLISPNGDDFEFEMGRASERASEAAASSIASLDNNIL